MNYMMYNMCWWPTVLPGRCSNCELKSKVKGSAFTKHCTSWMMQKLAFIRHL